MKSTNGADGSYTHTVTFGVGTDVDIAKGVAATMDNRSIISTAVSEPEHN
jgi:hypothetical protein